MHYIFGSGNDSHCLPEILNEEKFDSFPHVRDLICITIKTRYINKQFSHFSVPNHFPKRSPYIDYNKIG